MYALEILIPFVLSIIFEILILPKVSLIAYKNKLFDKPDKRKIHSKTIPRLAGISFFPVICFSTALIIALHNIWYGQNVLNIVLTNRLMLCFCSMIVLFLIGIMDDLIGAEYRLKFIAQIICGILITMSGLWLNNLYGLFGIHRLSPQIGVPLTIVLIIFITNAINLIDGIDGLAAGISAIAFLFLGILYFIIGQFMYVFIAFSALGTTLVFLYFNMHRRIQLKIFMGDTGSLTLGLLLSILVIHISSNNFHAQIQSNKLTIIAFSLLLIPLLDVTRVFMHRIRNKKSPFKPDNNHIHHKFLRLSFSQRRTLAIILLVDVILCLLNIVFMYYAPITILFILDVVLWIIFNTCLSYRLNKIN